MYLKDRLRNVWVYRDMHESITANKEECSQHSASLDSIAIQPTADQNCWKNIVLGR